MSFSSERMVTTKKDHTCFGYGKSIPAGTKCKYFAGVWQEGFSYGYMCGECVDSMNCEYFSDCFQDGYYYEGGLSGCVTCKSDNEVKG